MSYRISIARERLADFQKEIEPLKRAFDMLDDHLLVTDANGNILYANKAVERQTGYSITEVIGKNPGDLWGGRMPEEFYEEMWRVIKKEKKPFVGEVKNVRKEGREYWQELHITPILDASGEIKFFIAIEPNITERKRREQFRDEFISMIGHQLKNPVTALRWTLDMLSRTGGLNEKQRSVLETLYQETGGLRDLIGDLLVLARIENVELKKDPIDLAEEVGGIVDAMRRQYPTRTFSFEKDADKFPLIASRTLASQVFTNIIGNAADYTDRTAGRIKVRLKVETHAYIFLCKDNGIGIPAEDQPRIFSRFFRASNAAEKKPAGSGLGLFIVKMICDDLGWGVHCVSRAGEGTMVTITIPK